MGVHFPHLTSVVGKVEVEPDVFQVPLRSWEYSFASSNGRPGKFLESNVDLLRIQDGIDRFLSRVL